MDGGAFPSCLPPAVAEGAFLTQGCGDLEGGAATHTLLENSEQPPVRPSPHVLFIILSTAGQS